MAKTNSLKQYPVDKDGNIIWTIYFSDKENKWVDNVPFLAEMKMIGTRTAHNQGVGKPLWEDTTTGKQYIMHHSEVPYLLNNAIINKGYVIGYWRICKRGDSYGLEFAGEYVD